MRVFQIDLFSEEALFIKQVRTCQEYIAKQSKKFQVKENKALKNLLAKRNKRNYILNSILDSLNYNPIPDNWKKIIINSDVSFNPNKISTHAIS